MLMSPPQIGVSASHAGFFLAPFLVARAYAAHSRRINGSAAIPLHSETSHKFSSAMHDAHQQSETVVPVGTLPLDRSFHGLRTLRWCVALSWAGWLLSIGLLCWQHWMRVL